jgi:polyketide biosynthesis enoyl-CoA hydratase PksH
MALRVQQTGHMLALTIDRPAERNAIDRELLDEMAAAIARAESDSEIRVVAIQGQSGVFCTGTDLAAATDTARPVVEESARRYFRLLRLLTTTPKIVVSLVEGEAAAGGMGLLAASDHVICSETATFRLPEILLGLLPACVLPFLVRRVGFQRAYQMALTGAKLDARRAVELGVADQLASDTRDALRRFLLSIDRIPGSVAVRLKEYMSRFSPIPADAEDAAIACIADLVGEPQNIARVKDLIGHGLWQAAR